LHRAPYLPAAVELPLTVEDHTIGRILIGCCVRDRWSANTTKAASASGAADAKRLEAAQHTAEFPQRPSRDDRRRRRMIAIAETIEV
jgi:hypothetical protein